MKTPGRHGRQSGVRRAPFTLVELLVAMAVLALIMLMLFQFFAAAQNVWSLSAANNRVYENGRVLLDIISRDLQAATASDRKLREVPFYVGPNAVPPVAPASPKLWGERQMLAFVAAADPDEYARSEFAEISYDFYDDSNPTYAKYRYRFRRTLTWDRKVAGSDNADWDFYAQTTATGDIATAGWNTTGWYSYTPGPGPTALTDVQLEDQMVCGGVEYIAIACYEDDGAGNLVAIPTGTLKHAVPDMAVITVTLFDDRLMNLEDKVGTTEWDRRKARTRRTFTRTLFIEQQPADL